MVNQIHKKVMCGSPQMWELVGGSPDVGAMQGHLSFPQPSEGNQRAKLNRSFAKDWLVGEDEGKLSQPYFLWLFFKFFR